MKVWISVFMLTWVRSEQAIGGETISEQEHLMAQRVGMLTEVFVFPETFGLSPEPTHSWVQTGISLFTAPLSRALFQR